MEARENMEVPSIVVTGEGRASIIIATIEVFAHFLDWGKEPRFKFLILAKQSN